MSTNDQNIDPLSISDTFYDWYLKTNQIIEFVNPLAVYDIVVGEGLVETRTGIPGTLTINIGVDASQYGIDTIIDTSGNSYVVLDYNSLSANSVDNSTVFSIQNSGDSNTYKVEASDMLPPDLNGNHSFAGTITVADLIVDDSTILINNTGLTKDGSGIIVTGGTDPDVSFTYDENTSAWVSSENLGIKTGYSFVSDSATTTAIFPFQAIENNNQGRIDVRLGTTISAVPERVSLEAEFGTNSNSLTVSHYSNNTLIADIAEFSSSGSGDSSVIIKDTIQITDILNSTPFSQVPAIEHVPVTDSSGLLTSFVNRVILPANVSVVVGDVVGFDGTELVQSSPDNIENATVLGIVESISGTNATIILTGFFEGLIISGVGTDSLVPGTTYYLDPVTPGAVTSTDPDNTNGILDKPVFVAISTDSGIIIPDFPGIGATIISGSGGGESANNAFSIINVDTGNTEYDSLIASGEDSLTILAGNHISLESGTNSNEFTINVLDDFIENTGTANSYLTYDSSGSFAPITVDAYSILTRSSDGDLDSVIVESGHLVGRLDDTNGAIVSLSPSEVYQDILGFSGNSFIHQIEFLDIAGASVLNFDSQAGSGESLTIRAGANIVFEELTDNVIVINAVSSDTNGSFPGGGGSSMIVGLESKTQAESTSVLLFADNYQGGSTSYIEFASSYLVTNELTTISARPTSNFLKFQTGSTLVSHYAGDTLLFAGDSSISTTITSSSISALNTVRITLNANILADRISPKTSSADHITLSGKGAQNTFALYDSVRPADDVAQSTIILNAYDEDDGVDRVSTEEFDDTSLNNKYVTMYADSDATTSQNEVYSYPIKMFKLIVDQLECTNLVATEAVKEQEYITTIIPAASNPSVISGETLSLVRIVNDTNDGPDGTLIKFDDSDSSYTPSYIYKQHGSKYLRFTDGIALMCGTNYDTTSPVISSTSDSDNERLIDIIGSSTGSGIRFTDSGTSPIVGKIETNNLGISLSFEDSSLVLNSESSITTNTLTIVGTDTDAFGWKFDHAAALSANGHVLYVDEVADNIGTIKSGYIVKEYDTDADTSLDPLYTLYYTLA